ncbi:MAG: alpha/beta hydrolase [Candidatus Eisenbacteria bacterium]|uniref:Alpha/beta hydrolase n=1 Tax=Eiseniibacteriota bacterium TaxID=2212470 RepID=A0A538UAP3_UNCEI|nr:MAG: alpha/beta hydrolase [Candidatus Eisenbacteria bacterium]
MAVEYPSRHEVLLAMSAEHVGARYPDGWRDLVPSAWLAGWSPTRFDLGDGTTEIVTMGEGPPLLLLPPLPGYKEAFLLLAPRLARGHRVITFDLRERFHGAPTWQALMDDLERVADAHAQGPAVVMGHSLGAALAMRWAAERPERVTALVLTSPFAHARANGEISWKRWIEQPIVLASLRWSPPTWSRRLARGYARRGAWVFDDACRDHALDFVRHGVRGVPLALARRCVGLAFAHDVRDALPRITAPTLLVVGERETRWARRAAAEVAALVPHAERATSPGAAHLHPLSAPDFLADTVLGWLARTSGLSRTVGADLGARFRA